MLNNFLFQYFLEQQINFSTEISTADTLFKGMKTYREGGFEDLCDYANNVLHDFEIEAMGIIDG
jgi:hypothetical protein